MLLAVWLLITVLLLLSILCFIHVRKKYSFWQKLGVPFVAAHFPLGNIQHASHFMLDLYQELKGKHPFGGIFQFTEPIAMIIDPEMIKTVLVRDVRHFYDRGGYVNWKHDPLACHMLNSPAARWTLFQRGLSPVFSSGRLKAFFPEMVQMIMGLREFLDEKIVKEGEKIELKDMFVQHVTDVAMRFVLGVEGKNLLAPEGGLHETIARGAFLMPSVWKLFFMTSYRSIADKLHFKTSSPELTRVVQRVVGDIVTRKERNQQLEVNRRVDVVDQMLKQSGFNGRSSLTLDDIAAQVFLFIGAFEAVSVTIFYCLFELAQCPEVQQRARECVLESIEKYGGVTYEGITEMPYIDQCLNETLRKYSPAINLVRVVTEDYRVPDSSGIVLPKGLNVIVPMYAIHHDPEYYPEPERFDPDRFTPEACKERSPYVFLPFGGGPKNCIGYRQAKIQLRTMLAILLSSYQFDACTKVTQGTQLDGLTVIKPKGGLRIRVKKLNRNALFSEGKHG